MLLALKQLPLVKSCKELLDCLSVGATVRVSSDFQKRPK